ncbi:polyprenyl synthetase family protein [Solimicrobium silvestre]|nr:farnesyl diphosphate synthase [Solimicrobium silvestre]
MTTSSTLSDWMKQSQAHIEAALTDFLPSPQQTPTHLHEAMRYAVLDGGKRVRPLLVYAAGQLFDADYAELTRAACALEMIHAYSLVHDDMPCMDDDALRRGKPTVHVKFGEATALLVGDALQAQAFLILAQGKTAPARQLEMLRILAHSSGSLGMCGGQAIDLASVGCNLSRDQLEQMHQLKTGALLRASVLLGALCGQELNEIDQAALHRYSHSIGLAFQVVDDILDATSDSASLGKTAGKDAANNKPTYVSILGLAASQTLAENLRIEAHNALHSFTATMQNSRTQRLSQLADFIVQRSA